MSLWKKKVDAKIDVQIGEHFMRWIEVKPSQRWFHPNQIQCWICSFSLCYRRMFWPFERSTKIASHFCCSHRWMVFVVTEGIPLVWCNYHFQCKSIQGFHSAIRSNLPSVSVDWLPAIHANDKNWWDLQRTVAHPGWWCLTIWHLCRNQWPQPTLPLHSLPLDWLLDLETETIW